MRLSWHTSFYTVLQYKMNDICIDRLREQFGHYGYVDFIDVYDSYKSINNIKLVDELLSYRMNYYKPGLRFGYIYDNSLDYFCQIGNVEIVKYLLTKVNINECNPKNSSILLSVMRYNKVHLKGLEILRLMSHISYYTTEIKKNNVSVPIYDALVKYVDDDQSDELKKILDRMIC